MAKSMLNGVNPDDVVVEHGADALRLYEMFMGDFELPKPWDPRAMEGMTRFLKRVWRLIEEHDAAKAPADDPHLRLRHKTIKRVTHDLEAMKFNTAIAALMEYVNELTAKGATREDLDHAGQAGRPLRASPGRRGLGEAGRKGFLVQASWPKHDEALTIDASVTLAVQVNGKLRGSVDAAADAGEAQLRELALAIPKRRQAPGRQDGPQGHRGPRKDRQHRCKLVPWRASRAVLEGQRPTRTSWRCPSTSSARSSTAS
jgi:leucyl-tRNA synthetase